MTKAIFAYECVFEKKVWEGQCTVCVNIYVRFVFKCVRVICRDRAGSVFSLYSHCVLMAK